MKDDASFVSLGATFKPDEASVHESDVRRNWNTVFAEAVMVPHDDDSSDLPVAQTVTVDHQNENFDSPDTPELYTSEHATMHRFNCMVIILGYSFMIQAVATAFATELGAGLLYVVGAGFYCLAEFLKKNGSHWTLPLQTLFLILTALMLAADLLLLTIGIFLVEFIAGLAFIFCMIFGGVSAGADWHQHVRKVCHLTRWAFRGFHASWRPKRMQPFLHNRCDESEPIVPDSLNNPQETKFDYAISAADCEAQAWPDQMEEEKVQ